MWILTGEVNDYDQYGEYFKAAWTKKPTRKQLGKIVGEGRLEHVFKGGGRQKFENFWYHLHEMKEGEELKGRQI